MNSIAEELKEKAFPAWSGSPFTLFQFGYRIQSATIGDIFSETRRVPPLVCHGIGADKIEESFKNHAHEVSAVWAEPFSSKAIPIVIDYQIRTQQTHEGLLFNIREAMRQFETKTVVKFKEIDESDTQFYFAWIHIYPSQAHETLSCVGRSAGNNPIHLAPGSPPFAVTHELMHAIGFVHEHQRADRDRFVEVNPKLCTDPDYVAAKNYFPIGVYDPKSIMHYHYIDEEIKPKQNGQLTIEEKEILSKKDIPTDFSKNDIESIEFVYGTQLVCTFETTKKQFKSQPFYECVTCWGKDSRLGCCASCRKFCHERHEVIYHPPGPKEELFFCDCGVNKHLMGCTKASTGETPYMQPMFISKDDPSAKTICFPCLKTTNCSKERDQSRFNETLKKGVCACSHWSCKERTLRQFLIDVSKSVLANNTETRFSAANLYEKFIAWLATADQGRDCVTPTIEKFGRQLTHLPGLVTSHSMGKIHFYEVDVHFWLSNDNEGRNRLEKEHEMEMTYVSNQHTFKTIIT